MGEKKIIGYKVFNKDWSCKDFKFEVGKNYKHDGELELGKSGFHFCLDIIDCFDFYKFNSENKVAKVEAQGKVIYSEDGISCWTDEIFIIEKIPWDEVLKKCNIGKNNTGFKNIGNRNKGNENAGNGNPGSRNSGNKNEGNENSGLENIGDQNSGDKNLGSYNAGFGNVGSGNAGNFNSSNLSIGAFNSTQPETIRIFNKEIKMDMENLLLHEGMQVCLSFSLDRHKGYKESWRLFLEKLSDEEIALIKEIPGFDSNVFFDITGQKI